MNNDEIIREVMSRNPKKILNKAENYALYEAGLFGNKALTWNSYEEILRSDWKEGICMRSKTGISRNIQRKYFNIPIKEVSRCIEEWISMGIKKESITFNQSMPDEHLLIQGEILREEKLFCFHYSTVKKPMNLALKEKSWEIIGFGEVEEILRQKLTKGSYTDLEGLLAEFPYSIVEFSAYSIPVGNRANENRNTVFWEVRNY